VISDGPAARVVRTSFLLVVAVLLQVTIVADLRIAGAQGDLMLLIGIAAGLVAGPQLGATYGFAAGIAIDLLATTPFGLSALAFALTGYLAGMTREAFLRSAWWIPVLTAAAASAAGAILYVVLGLVVGQETTGRSVPTIVAVVAVMNALLAPLAVRAVRWAIGDVDSRSGLVLR
jgi:rod shape-determining protein MreD